LQVAVQIKGWIHDHNIIGGYIPVGLVDRTLLEDITGFAVLPSLLSDSTISLPSLSPYSKSFSTYMCTDIVLMHKCLLFMLYCIPSLFNMYTLFM